MDRAGHDPRAPLIGARSATQSPAAGAGSAPPESVTHGADARPPALRAFTSHPAAGQLTLLVCYLAAGVAVTWPRATYITGRLPSMRDSAAYVWGFWWMARRVSHLANPWVTNHMAAPAGVLLGYHTLMPLPGLLLTPVTLIFGPSASYNLLVIVVPGLLCYAMYRAARLWLPSQTGAIAAGAFFGLSAMLAQEDWYHINIAVGALFLPLALEASVRLRRSPGWRQAVILGVVVGAAVLTDPESAVLTGILAGLVLLPWLLWRPSVARLWPVALGAVIAAIVAGPQLAAMIHEQARGGLHINPELLGVTDKLYGVGLPGMFAPTPRVADFALTSFAQPFLHSRDNEGLPMFGVTLTALALFGLVVAWRQRRAWQLALLWLGCAALALGMSLWVGNRQFIPWTQVWQGVHVSPVLPYTWFVRIPGLSAFREADRMAILGLVPAALLAGAAVNWMRYHARPLIAVVVALAVLELGYSGNAKIGDDGHRVSPAGRADRRRPLRVDSGRRPLRDARRHPRVRRPVRGPGAGDGDGGRPPARRGLRIPDPGIHPERDREPRVLHAPDQDAAFHLRPDHRAAHRGGPAVAAAVGQETLVLYPADPSRRRRRAAGRPDAAYRVGRGVVLKSGHCAVFAPDRLPLCLPGGRRLGLPPRPLSAADAPLPRGSRGRPPGTGPGGP